MKQYLSCKKTGEKREKKRERKRKERKKREKEREKREKRERKERRKKKNKTLKYQQPSHSLLKSLSFRFLAVVHDEKNLF